MKPKEGKLTIGDMDKEDSVKFIEAVYTTSLNEVQVGLDRPIEESDVAEEKVRIENNLRFIHEFLARSFDTPDSEEIFNDFTNKEFKYKTVVHILFLCGEHSNENDVWTTNSTIELSKSIVDILCKHYSCSDVDDLINSDNFTTLIFGKLQRKLLKNTWKCFPAAVSCYIWVLLKIKLPEMGRILHLVMPTILILLDDFEMSYRIRGLMCLQHVIKNITKTELSWYCEKDILYKTLRPMIYNMESGLVKPLINCLVVVLNKIVPSEDKLMWTYYDDILGVWLASIEIEQKLALRKEYMESLSVFLDSMGLSCVRWSVTLLRIFEQYSTVPEDKERCFNALYTFMKVTWPRVHSNFQQLCMIILKALYDLVVDNDSTVNENEKIKSIDAVVKCLNLFRLIVPDEFKRLCQDISGESSLSQNFKAYLKT